MNRRARLCCLPLTGVSLLVLGACNSNDYPNLFNPYEAGIQGPGSGPAGGGTLDAQVDVSLPDTFVPDAGTDHSMPVDAAKDTAPGTDGATGPCKGCSLIYTATSPIASITLDPTYVYWTIGGSGGSIWQADRTTLTPASLGGGLDSPLIIKVSPGPYIAWSALGAGAGTGSVSLEYTGAPTLVGTSLTSPFGVAIDTISVYWVSSAGGGVTVQSEPLSLIGANTLGTAPGAALVPQGMAVNATSIYFVASGPGAGLFELPLTGGTPTQIWTGDSTSQPIDVALDGSNVYWTDQGDGNVYSMPLAGGAVTTMAMKGTMGITGPYFIAVDSTNVYFSDPLGMALYEVSIASSTLKQLVASASALSVLGVAADDNDGNVYFSAGDQVLSIAK
jgi:hypothetical protein